MRHPNGYGSIFKLGGKRRRPWAVRLTAGWTDKGKQKFKYLGYYKTRPEAIAALAEYNKSPFDIDARKITFAEMYEMWFKSRFKGDENPSTIKSYKSAYDNATTLHDAVFSDLRAHNMQSVIDNSGLKKSSNNNIKKLFSQMSKYALQYDYIEKDYTPFLTVPDNDEPSKRSPFTSEEIEELWRIKDDVSEAALIMIYTGLRPTELLLLKNENIYIEERYLIGGMKTAAGTDRTIPLNKKIIPLIEKRLNNKYLFLNAEGGKASYGSLKSRWDKSPLKTKMKHNPHDCRHTCRTLLHNADANTVSIDRIMGHASQNFGDRVYTHKDLPQLLKAIDLI